MLDGGDPLLLITLLVFICAGLIVYAATQILAQRERVRRRFAGLNDAPSALSGSGDVPWRSIDPARLGIDRAAQRALQADLIRAGFFEPTAVTVYGLTRLALLALFPLLGLIVCAIAFPGSGTLERVLIAAILLAIAYVMPRATLARRQRALEVKYRLTFPDFIDMLVICINAGLSLEAALDRAARELGAADRELRANLALMAAEMRAGKSTGEALRMLADRLGLREARSFAALLHQTLELGTDIAQALTTFADEMRDKRMARAEEKAAALPPKLTLPLGLCIFPVVLIVVLAPAVLRVMRVTQP